MSKKGLSLSDRLIKVLISNIEDYSLEHRIFIAACFVGGIAGLLASIINLSLSLHPNLIITTIGITVLYFLFYYLSLREKIYKYLIIPYIFISLLTLSFIWFINAGSGGPVFYIIVTALLVYIIITRGETRIIALIVVVITITALYLWEYLHPEIVVNYTSEKAKFLDLYFTALFSIGLIAFITSFIMKNYHDEREKVIRQRDTIIEQNKEIKAAENELLRYQENLEELVKVRTHELEETNRQLLVAKDKAEESDRLKTAFLSNLSHEIRTPMNAILGFSYLLREKGLSDKSRNHYVDIITSKSNLLLNIINDIIDISKMEAGGIELHQSSFNVYTALDELYSTFSLILQNHNNKQIVLRINRPENTKDVVILTDLVRLKQVLYNLLDNAIKFTQEGFVEFGYKIISDNGPKEISFFVSDSGIGISPDNMEFIFNRFRQIDESNTREYGGTGLGLSISRKLVELLEGNLKVDSVYGKGSTFYFSIPFRQPN